VALITLTTDFGTRDPYVAQLKAVLYGRGPAGLQVVDLSHAIAPQDVRAASLFVEAALSGFPAGTTHLVVVDPGVGSARRPIAVEQHGQRYVGPDNGVLSLRFDGTQRAVEIEIARLNLPPPSATFHGRDVFAPAAAALASGCELEALGPVAHDLVRLLWPEPARAGDSIHGEVIHIDHFGNLITNLRSEHVRSLGHAQLAVELHEQRITLATHYAEVPRAALVALIGSSDRLEIAVRDGHAARSTGAAVGARVCLQRA